MNLWFSNIKGLLFLIGLTCCYGHFSSAQDQRLADSLSLIYRENELEDVDKLNLLKDLAYNEMDDLEKALEYANELIELSESMNEKRYSYSGHLQKGYKYTELGKFDLALTEFFESSKIATNIEDISAQGIAFLAIGDLYNKMGLTQDAEENYEKAKQLLRKSNEPIKYATILLNRGELLFQNKEYDKALQLYEESLPIFNESNDSLAIAYNLGNMGMVYTEQGKDSLAEANLIRSIDILENLKDYSAISIYLLYLSDVYAHKGDMPIALNKAKTSLELAKKIGLKAQIRDAYLKLSELNKSIGNIELASIYLNNYIAYRDSINNFESERKIANLRVKQKNTENDLINQKRKNQRNILYATAIALFLLILLAIGLFHRYKYVRKTNKIISTEKQRSDNLLLNILPEDTAQELKNRGKVQAKRYESVTVLFTDFENFTIYAEQLPPEQVVTAIDYYFSKFDEIIGKYGLEKIKTVGDAYMCAGGLPLPTKDHAYKVILAAFEIINFVDDVKNKSNKQLAQFNIRIGINSGPVVAGVVGSKKFAYDIWGDSVNIASRMESASAPGKINISENTYQLVKDRFNCKFRGKVEVKNRGILKMYYVDGLKSFES